jgi:hypothetical protein
MSAAPKIAAFLPLFSLGTALAQQTKHEPRYAEETPTETLWRTRYAHCDYGYYVILPSGFVGHGSHSPAPNHGFLVALPDVGRKRDASIEDERFIWVNAEYNSLEFKSLAEAADRLAKSMGKDKKGFRQVAREPVRLDGKPAMRIQVEYLSPRGKVMEEEVLTLRAGILYEIGLRTTDQYYYATDPESYRQVFAGFRFWRIHYC